MVNDHRLHDAFHAIRSFSENSLNWETTTEIDLLEQNYRAMLGYFASGVDDPERQQVLADLLCDVRAIADTLARNAMMSEAPQLYFSTARTLAVRRRSVAATIAALMAELARLRADITTVADPRRTVAAEQLSVELFNRLWTTHPLTTDDLNAATNMVLDTDVPMHYRASAVSALAAGAIEVYDARRAVEMLKIYMAPVEPEIALRALIGFTLIMFRYRRRPIPRRLADAMATAREFPTWSSDICTVTIELIRARDTERITQRMSNDIIPTLNKLAPEIQDRMSGSDTSLDDLAEGRNPAWDDLLERDGLGAKLREMSEIQADGGDVYMSSFSSLKHFPFFSDMANWFMPFTPDHSAAADAETQQFAENLAKMPFLCDSDKYSVLMALASAPSHLREGAARAMHADNGQMREMMSQIEKFTDTGTRKNIVTGYVRDLYRFYNLFRRKGDFFNPFKHGIDLMAIDALSVGVDDIDTLTVIAEFEMRHKFWEEAVAVFKRIYNMAEPDAARAQKIGFALERLGRYSEAISYYEEARMLGSTGKWILEHTGRTYRALGEPRQAIEVLKELSELEPESYSVAVTLGNTYLEARRTDEALAQFHKAVYLAPESLNARRGLAWSLFMTGDHERAAKEYERLVAAEPTAEDYLNAGHTHRAMRHNREAINYYTLSMQKAGQTPEEFETTLSADHTWLAQAGLNTDDDRMFIEAIQYGAR